MAARDILAAADQMEGMEYIPKTAETRETYELILSAVHEALGGEQPQDVLRDATDFVIVTLKDESLKDFDKKKEINTAIPGLTTEMFTTLVNLGKKITDFGSDDADQAGQNPDEAGRDGAQIDDDVGVAVVFEEDEEDEDRIGDEEDEEAAFEVRDESEDEDAVGRTDGEAEENGVAAEAEDDDDQEIVIGGAEGQAATSSKGRKAKASDDVPARDIDGFWLQRLISGAYPDPHETAEKTSEAMTILSSESNTRDVENSLMDLFDYDSEKFGMVRILLKNREKIVWCTKLARSDESSRLDVEVVMREKGVGWILKELASAAAAVKAEADGTGTGDDKAAVAEAMAVPKANIAAGSLVQPKGTVDLESMVFTQGARLMTNKKCRLPEGSFKRSKKGYEEIHVPPPKSNASSEKEQVPISDLEEWMQPAFKGARSLNRVQSRLYPVAYGDDDPILLCAPTGAGKVGASKIYLSAIFNGPR